jgi:3-oxoacyl-[acyl-carrier protein] reductase
MMMNSLLLSSALLLASSVGSAHAFLGTKLPASSFVRATSSSSLQMVAADAKVCVVTGSSRGLGKAIALELGKHGQKVVINYVSEGSKGAADDTVREIMAMGGDAMAVQADSTCKSEKVDKKCSFLIFTNALSSLHPFVSLCRA